MGSHERRKTVNRETFFAKFNTILDEEDVSRIAKAYWLAKETHRTQKRDGGERYFEHCRDVACILIDSGSVIDPSETIVALLHDCIEDGFIPQDILVSLFGRYIADAVALLSKLVPVYDPQTGHIVEKRKKTQEEYFGAIASASRWIRRIKLADRLHNLQTMGSWDRARQQKYIAETETYILPIARMTDQILAEAVEAKVKKFSGPYVFEVHCANCERKTVTARATLWMENKFLKYEYLKDRGSWASQEKPVGNPQEVRDILVTGSWSQLAKIMNLGKFYCHRGEHFYCRGCVKFYDVCCDEPGWSPVEFTPKCPTHGR